MRVLVSWTFAKRFIHAAVRWLNDWRLNYRAFIKYTVFCKCWISLERDFNVVVRGREREKAFHELE